MESLGGNPKLIMEDFTRYMRLLVVLVKAVARLVSSGRQDYTPSPSQPKEICFSVAKPDLFRELSHLAGYTSRVAQLYKVLDDINSGSFVR